MTGADESDERAVGLATLTRGYKEALARFRERVVTPTTLTDAYLPLFETLEWASSIEQKLARPPDKHLDTQNDHVGGMRFVRNRVYHQWALAIDFEPGTGYGEGAFGAGPYGGDPSRWVWLPIANLPPPDDDPLKGRRAVDRERYVAVLAGSPVASTLDALDAFFDEQEERGDA